MLARKSYVALVGDQMVGFSDVNNDGYVGMMFVSPRFARKGVARELMCFLEYGASQGVATQLSSNVSITARPFFEARGVHVETEQQPVIEDVVMTNLHMTKQLS